MRISQSTFCSAIASLLLASTFAMHVQSKELPEMGRTPTFEEIDINADGMIAGPEARKNDVWLADNFRVFDSNQDGYINKDEFIRAVKLSDGALPLS